MPKKKKTCDEALERWFDEALERIKKATGARTQVQLAEVLDVRQSSISDAKRRCSIPAEWYLKLYRSHGLDPDWIADGAEPIYLDPAKAKVPADTVLKETKSLYGKPHSRGRVVTVSTMAGEDKDAQNWIPQNISDLSIPESYHYKGLQVLKVDNASMEPLIKRGAFIGVDTEQNQHPDGDLCAVHFPHQGLLIRRVYFANNVFILKADNPAYTELSIPVEEMSNRCLGRVVWVLQNLNDH